MGATAGQLRGESTPFYLYDRDAQRRIRELIPDVKMIAMLRDPVERAHSNWAHLWSAGLDPVGDFVKACAEEDRRVAAGWADFWHYKRLGKYGEQLEHLYLEFPRDQVLVLRYRQLVEAPVQTLDRDLRLPGRAAGRRHRGAQGERDRAPGRVAGPPAGVPVAPRRRGHQPAPAGHDRHGDHGPAGADAAARRPAAAAADLGAASGAAARTSTPTSGCWRRSPSRTSATGCSRGSGPAAWSATGPRASARRATASPGAARCLLAPPGR